MKVKLTSYTSILDTYAGAITFSMPHIHTRFAGNETMWIMDLLGTCFKM